MKIKMKMKYLILIALAGLIFIFTIIPYASIEIANHFSQSKQDLSKNLYSNYIKYPTGGRKAEAIFKKSQLLAEDFGMYSIMFNGSGGGVPVNMEDMEEVKDGYKEILDKYPDDNYYRLAYKNLMDLYVYLGDQAELEKLIVWGENEDELHLISKIYDSYHSFLNREYKDAEIKLQEVNIEENKELKDLYYYLKGDIALGQERYDLVKENYEKVEENWNLKDNFYYRNPNLDRKNFLKEAYFLKGKNKLSGRVTSDGRGIAFVEIFIKRPGSGFMSRGENYATITDGQGYYETPGIKDGDYDIGIGIATPLLYDKVFLQKNINDSKVNIDSDREMNFEFASPMEISRPNNASLIEEEEFQVEWKAVEGADYYNVNAVAFDDGEKFKGNSITVVIEDENGEIDIKDNKAVFNIERLRASARGGFIVNEEFASPLTILGYFYPGTEHPIIVNAYDKDGHMMGSTMPSMTYYDQVPSVIMDDRELTEGEKLIKYMKYQEAIDHYKEVLEDKPENLPALEYLSRIYSVNWKEEGRDTKTSLEYVKDYYRYSGGKNILDRVLIEAEHDDMVKNKELILGIMDELKDSDILDDYSYSRADMYRAIGRWDEARELYLDMDQGYIYSGILFMDIYLGDEDLARERLNDERLSLGNMNRSNLILAINGLMEMDREDLEYKEFRDFLMRFFSWEIHYEDRAEEFRETYNSIEDKNIRTILKEIEKDNYF